MTNVENPYLTDPQPEKAVGLYLERATTSLLAQQEDGTWTRLSATNALKVINHVKEFLEIAELAEIVEIVEIAAEEQLRDRMLEILKRPLDGNEEESGIQVFLSGLEDKSPPTDVTDPPTETIIGKARKEAYKVKYPDQYKVGIEPVHFEDDKKES